MSWYWNRANFEGLAQVARRFAAQPATADLGQHYLLRERGLRKEAFQALESFVACARQWTEPDQRDFAQEILELHLARPEIHQLLPSPLLEKLLLPLLKRWRDSEPEDGRPLAWLALLGQPEPELLLRQALQLDPASPLARELLVRHLLRALDFALHELPHHCLGQPETLLAQIDEALEWASPEQRPEVERRRLLVRDWLEFQERPEGLDFAAWCATRGRKYRWLARYPYRRKR